MKFEKNPRLYLSPHSSLKPTTPSKIIDLLKSKSQLKLPNLTADGRFALAVAAGTYTVVLGGSNGWAQQELPVVVEAGVKKRLDGVVGPAV